MLEHLNAKPEPPRRTVVIGAAGFVGSSLANKLAQAGAETLLVTRNEVDLLTPDAADKLRALLSPEDTVVAVSAIAPCKNTTMLVQNMILTSALVDAIASVQVSHVLNFSSDAVYPDKPLPLTEKTPAAPGSLHGAMHLAREISFQSEIETPLAILRPTLMYGANDPHNGYGPNRFRRQVATGEDITLFGEGEERRDHVWVEDVAELATRVIMNKSIGTLNAATGTVISFRECAEAINAMDDNPVTISGSPRSGPMPHDGYRPFDVSGTSAAFPDFTYTQPLDGFAKVRQQELGMA